MIVLVIAGAFYFLVAQASAAVSVPAQLVVLNPATTLTHSGSAQPATTGALVHAGDAVRNDASGRSLIQFQDGSITRLAPDAKITLQAAEFDKQGRLSNVNISQQAGRTMTTVEKLIGAGAKFTVSGHSANASVRGTKFEVIQNADGSFRLKVYVGSVHLQGTNEVIVSAGQQADATAGGAVSKPVTITVDLGDPFTLWLASEEAAKALGQAATAQTSFDTGAIGSGQTAAQPDYNSAGGEVVGELAYPGSSMTLSITDPAGKVHEATGGSPGPAGKLLVVDIPGAPGGVFKVSVKGVDVNPAEHFTVTMITKFVCSSGDAAAGGFVRNVLSAKQTADALTQAGGQDVSVGFRGASAGGADISASGSFGGVKIAASALLYAAGGGNVGAAVTAAQVNGVDLKQQLTNAIAQGTGRNLDSLDIGYPVDRVYTCSGGNDQFLVIEGRG